MNAEKVSTLASVSKLNNFTRFLNHGGESRDFRVLKWRIPLKNPLIQVILSMIDSLILIRLACD